MWEILLVILIGLSEPPHNKPVEFCQYDNGELCCAWSYTEVGCYEEFFVEETWCISSSTNYRWEKLSWHDNYLKDNCARCPECCVQVGDRAELEDVHCTSDVCPGPECPCVQDHLGVWWVDETLSFDDEDMEEDF